jgi:hypothetical protein
VTRRTSHPVHSVAGEIVDARLDRAPRDAIEAAVVLEAWDGRPAASALSAAGELIDPAAPAPVVNGRPDPLDERERTSVAAEAVALVLSVLSVAAWAGPLGRALGPDVLQDAISCALPIALALQWALRSRYLSRSHGLSLLAREPVLGCMVLALVGVAVVIQPRWGPMAGLLIATWVGGTIVTRRGWGLLYALGLAASTVALSRFDRPYEVIGALAATTLLLCVLALWTRRQPSDQRPGTVPRALMAALLGGGIGLLLVEDPSLGWGVHGLHPAIALVPSVIGSFWGGYYLWKLYGAVPRALSGVPLERANRFGVDDPAMRIFLGSVARLLGATIVLSLVVASLGRWTHGTDALTVFVAFGCAALVTMMVSLLESLSMQRAAAFAVAIALSAELAWRYLVETSLAGSALAVGALAGVMFALPCLLVLLSRSGRVLATLLWIR